MGVSTKTISNWERGAYPATFNVPQIKALCRELQCSLEDLPDNFGPARSPDQA
ncbi:MAG: helix-turn-helix transcriptional regulator [Coleofasciculus sp. G3-WIS-01]|uniref:helix-turn-helix transcriptional regulator n=1 Tax=Coleofasciculus sp. G3-WIS-01 TaxID=3069528 RepID=UPI0032FEB026